MRPKTEIRTPKSDSIRTHKSMEPSWFAQTPVILYKSGLAEWEFNATSRTEKSETTNAHVSAANDVATATNCTCAAVSATRIAPARRVSAPHNGTTD